LAFIFDGISTFRVPTREESKDWKYFDGQPEEERGKTKTGPPISRAFGWLDFKFGEGSSINFNIPLHADNHGYPNTIGIKLHNVSAVSSVNYATLLEALTVEVTAP
jgi:hypothetical protein